MEEDNLFGDLADFTPSQRPPQHSSTSSLPYPLDPALATHSNNYFPTDDQDDDDDDDDEQYWEDGSDRDPQQDDYDSGSQAPGGEDDGESDETDAEEEFAATQRGEVGGVKRVRKSQGGLTGEDEVATPSAKGKERAVDQDAPVGGAEDDDEENTGEEINRLISAMRDSASTGVGGMTALDKEFDKSIAYELDGFDPDLIEDMAVGIKGRKRKKGNGGRRRAAADVEPSPEVKRLLGQANHAYAEGRLLEAIEQLSEVIRIDPIIRSSWYTLATIYEELEETEKAVQCKIVATHLMGSKQAAADWVEIGRTSRDLGLLHQAIYCFTQAVKANKQDVDAMWDRAILLKLSGATGMATRAFLALLSLLPHDPGVLRELSPLLASTVQFQQATSLLLAAFSYYRSTIPIVTPQTVHLLNTYGYGDLETLADFLQLQKDWGEMVRVIRQGVRWLQGRERETGWDAMEDDREFDEERKVREGWEKGNVYFEDEPTYELDVRLRSRLGLARLGMGRIAEAQHHFEILFYEDVSQFPELFGAVGEAYYERKMYASALDVYQLIAENEETNGPTVWGKIAACHQATGDWDEARECYENVIAEEPDNLEAKLALAKVLEHLGDAGGALGLIKDVISVRDKANRKKDPSERRPRKAWRSKDERSAARANAVSDEQARQAEFVQAFQYLSELDPDVAQGNDDAVGRWLETATRLVESFRSTKQLFPYDFRKKFVGVARKRYNGKKKKKERDVDAEADQMADRLQDTIDGDEQNELEETTFRGLDFEGWVDFILKYCFLLAQADEVELAAEVLLHVREASVMRQSQTRQESLRLGLIACYLSASMYPEVVTELRFFLRTYPHQTEPQRLLLALLSQTTGAIDAINNSQLQKFMYRELRQIYTSATGGAEGEKEKSGSPAAVRGASAMPAPTQSGSAKTKGKAAGKGKGQGKGKEKAVDQDDGEGGEGREDAEQEEENEEGGDEGDEGEDGTITASSFKPTQLSPLYYVMYGFLLHVSQSHQPAIIYLLRAYELDKKQPLINLTLATAYIQRSMSRKTDNRQHQIAQGFAFLDQYRRLRGPCQESEYNLARAFHHLGIHSHAVKHYESVLALPETILPSSAAEDSMALDDDADALPTPPADRYASNDYHKVAAYNLVTLYAMAGLPEMARGVAERWLAV